ncbi:MAG: DUF6132 family protein [Methanococcaceae archaeon]
MKIDKKIILKKSFPVLAGAALGFAYYYFIGCTSGSCPITGNPYISTAYGAFAGSIFSFQSKSSAS